MGPGAHLFDLAWLGLTIGGGDQTPDSLRDVDESTQMDHECEFEVL